MGDEQMTQEQKGKTPVLDVQNLTKIYDNGGKGDENEVLKNVNFTMNEGEFVCSLSRPDVERLRSFAASAVLKPLTERSK